VLVLREHDTRRQTWPRPIGAFIVARYSQLGRHEEAPRRLPYQNIVSRFFYLRTSVPETGGHHRLPCGPARDARARSCLGRRIAL
jgi:hypothetical protein